MFDTQILDVAIGLVFVYLTVSLAVTTLSEFVAQLSDARGKNLSKGIERLLLNKNLADSFFELPVIKALSGNVWNPKATPSYISPEIIKMGIAMLRKTQGEQDQSKKEQSKREQDLENLKWLDTLTDSSKIDEIIKQAEEQMKSLYRNYSRYVVGLVALLACAFLNVDSIKIARTLMLDEDLRNQIVKSAVEQSMNSPLQAKHDEKASATTSPQGASGSTNANVEDGDARPAVDIVESAQQTERMLSQTLAPITSLIGWTKLEWNTFLRAFSCPLNFGFLIQKTFGILLSTCAVSLGAPFWFNALQKLLKIRSAIRPEDTEEPAATKE